MNLRQLTPLEQAQNELKKRNVRNKQMRTSMKCWDKKLSNLDDEMLYYVFNRASSIIEHRQKQEMEQYE